jgi:hypothetical protein
MTLLMPLIAQTAEFPLREDPTLHRCPGAHPGKATTMIFEEERAAAQKALAILERMGSALAATAQLTALDRNQAAGFASDLGEPARAAQSAISSFSSHDNARSKRHQAFLDLQALRQALSEHWSKSQ